MDEKARQETCKVILRIRWSLLLLFLAFVACNGSQGCMDGAGSGNSGRWQFIRDDQDRALILHGLNNLSAAKGAAQNGAKCNKMDAVLPLSESDVEREIREWGFNAVRYLISWACIEPEKGVFDEDYLRQTAERVRWYADRNAHVILDMHQDIYGYAVNGNGAPLWATETDGHVPQAIGAGPWWLQAIDPAVTAAYKNFWAYDQYRYLQDHYIQAWQKVAEYFKDESAVIGYDLMNEPYGGNFIAALDGTFEIEWLAPFYERLIPALRQVDKRKWLFYEPLPFPITTGIESALPRIQDALAGDQRLVYAPHLYPFDFHEGNGYTAEAKSQAEAWVKSRQLETGFQRAPLLVGEFGGSEEQVGGLTYFRDIMQSFDQMKASWTLWSGDPGSWGPVPTWHGPETKKMGLLVRPYPRATAGDLVEFRFDDQSKAFEMRFSSRAGVEGPTEIFIPARHYPNGFDVEMSDPAGTWRQEWDASRSILRIWHNRKTATHSIRVFAR